MIPIAGIFLRIPNCSEVLLIARKRDYRIDTDQSVSQERTQFISLWLNPRTSAHALAIGEQISRGAPAPIGAINSLRHGVSEIVIGSQKYGEAVEIPWGDVKSAPWIGAAFAQTNLLRTAWMMRQGRLYMPGHTATIPIPIGTIGDIGILRPRSP